MTGRLLAAAYLAAAAIALGSACGDGSDPAPSPTTGSGGGGGGGSTSGTTITITSSGVSPKTLTVARGTQVTFTNNDSVSHQMESDPHPAHTDCPEINSVGFISPGQSKMTGNLNTARSCGYHDHNRNTDTSLQGTIVIQ
jgi:plastocyanin